MAKMDEEEGWLEDWYFWSNLCQQSRTICPFYPQTWHWVWVLLPDDQLCLLPRLKIGSRFSKLWVQWWCLPLLPWKIACVVIWLIMHRRTMMIWRYEFISSSVLFLAIVSLYGYIYGARAWTKFFWMFLYSCLLCQKVRFNFFNNVTFRFGFHRDKGTIIVW